ncbi:MAG: hypothetical protein RMJ43_00585 [Chloroherpetonaceae bacterium]|nr:hypothetical protein [Chthonomonadaceae bacterium]MDW8206305.1 hypothetical protein [Chloroherpetonaceae bacterium]
MRLIHGLLCASLIALSAPLQAADYFESEPNDTFPPGFLPGDPVFNSGDRLRGRIDVSDIDQHYIRFVGTGAPGIYRYELNMVEGGDGTLALFDASSVGWYLGYNDDFPGNGLRPRLFFDHFDPTGAETIWGVEVAGFSIFDEFDYTVAFNRSSVAVTPLGSVGMGSLTASGSVEPGRGTWFCFDVSQPGLLTLLTEADFDTELALFDSSGNTIGGDDDRGPGLMSLIELSIQPGTYYAVVGGYNARYNWNIFDDVPAGWDRDGFGNSSSFPFNAGDFLLNINLRPAAVPEPGVVGLWVASGIAACSLLARRRR